MSLPLLSHPLCLEIVRVGVHDGGEGGYSGPADRAAALTTPGQAQQEAVRAVVGRHHALGQVTLHQEKLV